ncbi:hypothetical protein S83_027849 [Arachis hypogaea]|nr:uncharacterized protein DS421_9g259170 [Arachis hypogaea]
MIHSIGTAFADVAGKKCGLNSVPQLITTMKHHDGLINVKECGVHPVFSGLVSVLQGVELNLELKLDFGVKMNLAIDIMNHKDVDEYKLLVALENGFELDDQLKMDFESRSRAVLMLIGKESSGTETKLPAQECDSSEKCSCSCGCLLESRCPWVLMEINHDLEW